MDEKEMLKKIAELEAALASLKSQMDAMRGEKVELEGDKEKMGAELEEAKAELKEKTAELITLKEEKVTAEKEAKFSELINEGKITPAQKEDFMKMDLKLAESFFANAPVLNLNESGHGKTPKGETGNKSVDEKIEEKALALMEENKTLKLGEAYSQVMKENPELAKQYDEQFKNVVES